MSGLFGGDPRMLFLEGDDPSSASPAEGVGGPSELNASEPVATLAMDDGRASGAVLSPDESLLARAAEDLPESDPPLGLAEAVQVAETAHLAAVTEKRNARASLIERVRADALRERTGARADDAEVSVFDHGYTGAPTGPSLLDRVRRAREQSAGALAERMPTETVVLADRGAVGSGGSEVRPSPGPDAVDPAEETPERPTGPLRIFVGGTATSREEALRDDARGPVWDSAALRARTWEGDGRTGDWGDNGSELFERVPLPVGTQNREEAADPDWPGMDRTPEGRSGSDASLARSDDPVTESAPLQEAARASTWPVEHADFFALGADASADEGNTDGSAPPAVAREARLLPPLQMSARSQLEELLSEPLREESPASARRLAPYADPDPWTTGAFQRVALDLPEEPDLPPDDSLESLTTGRHAQQAGVLPALEPVPVPGPNRTLMLVLASLLVVVSAVVWMQFQKLRDQDRVVALPRVAAALGAPAAGDAASPAKASHPPAPVPAAASAAAVSLAAGSSLPPLREVEETTEDREMGLVEVRATRGMRVWVDGVSMGRTPLAEPLRLSSGAHRVRVGRTETRVSVAPGRLVQVQF